MGVRKPIAELLDKEIPQVTHFIGLHLCQSLGALAEVLPKTLVDSHGVGGREDEIVLVVGIHRPKIARQ
jgi:hypothetical protein